jgi:hypothetical protein
MPLWYRVFGGNDVQPAPAALLEHLQRLGFAVTGSFAGDDAGWFGADLVVSGSAPLHLERFLVSEPGIRAELNNWAAWLETCADNPHHVALMERTIQTRQLFTLERPEDADVEQMCLALCRFLATTTDGFYQVDQQGVFAADGTLLVAEP